MTDQKIMMECDTCSKKFQFGPHQYEGRVINLYGITVCDTCWTGSWDGWAPHFEPIIQKHLAEKIYQSLQETIKVGCHETR
jgi:hypothetical protein